MAIVKIIELIGISDKSWQEAAENAISEAGKTVRNITGINVIGWTAEIKNGKIINYKANVKIAFMVERPE